MLKRMVLLIALLTWAAHVPAPARAQEHAAAETAHAANDAAKSAAAAPHNADAAMEHGGEGEHEEKPPLLPDPTSRVTQLQALWVVIIFIVLLVILYPTAWRNVLAGLKAREQKIRQDIADAEASRKKAEQTLGEYNAKLAAAEGQIRDMLAKATADAEKLATSLRMQAQQEAEEAKERAQRDIEAARKSALTDIYAQAAELSTNIAEKILRRNLNPDDQRDIVARSLEQLQTAGKV